MSIHSIKNKMLDLLFPPRCEFCGEILSINNPCGCKNSLVGIDLSSGPLNFSEDFKEHLYIKNIWACYIYKKPINKMIIRFKFENEPELAGVMGEMLYKIYKSELFQQQEIDYFIPVPISEKAKKERGYCQTNLLAESLMSISGAAVLFNELYKTTDTQKQASLNRKDRLTNVKNSFSIANNHNIEGKNICLIDDIVTTGSTLQECAKTLQEAKPKNIYALCLASTPAKHI